MRLAVYGALGGLNGAGCMSVLRLAALFAGVNQDRQILLDAVLAQQIGQQMRPQGVIHLFVGFFKR